jgi:hypothetical protein
MYMYIKKGKNQIQSNLVANSIFSSTELVVIVFVVIFNLATVLAHEKCNR